MAADGQAIPEMAIRPVHGGPPTGRRRVGHGGPFRESIAIRPYAPGLEVMVWRQETLWDNKNDRRKKGHVCRKNGKETLEFHRVSSRPQINYETNTQSFRAW
jgi:hypothetical protein